MDFMTYPLNGATLSRYPFKAVGDLVVFTGHEMAVVSRDGVGLLPALVSLASGSRSDVLAFLDKWGPLEHGAPDRMEKLRDVAIRERLDQRAIDDLLAVERLMQASMEASLYPVPYPTSIAAYLELAGFVHNLLSALAKLRVNPNAKPEEVLPASWTLEHFLPPDGVDDGAEAIVCEIPSLLRAQNEHGPRRIAAGYGLQQIIRFVAEDTIQRMWSVEPRPGLWCDSNNDFSIELDPGSGLSIIGYQLSRLFSEASSPPALCHCGELFIPNRKPRSDQKTWCTSCRERGEPQRFASAQYRLRRSQGER